MMSVQMQKVHKLAEEYDKTRTAYNFGSMSVEIRHEDGSYYFLDSAFIKRHDDGEQKWILVFSEHNGLHVFAENDLYSWKQFERKEVDEWL